MEATLVICSVGIIIIQYRRTDPSPNPPAKEKKKVSFTARTKQYMRYQQIVMLYEVRLAANSFVFDLA